MLSCWAGGGGFLATPKGPKLPPPGCTVLSDPLPRWSGGPPCYLLDQCIGMTVLSKHQGTGQLCPASGAPLVYAACYRMTPAMKRDVLPASPGMKHLNTSFLAENSCQPTGQGFGLKSSARNENCRSMAHGPTLRTNTGVGVYISLVLCKDILLIGVHCIKYLGKRCQLFWAIHVVTQRSNGIPKHRDIHRLQG